MDQRAIALRHVGGASEPLLASISGRSKRSDEGSYQGEAYLEDLPTSRRASTASSFQYIAIAFILLILLGSYAVCPLHRVC